MLKGLSSFVLQLLPLKSTKTREILRKFAHRAVQGHPRSSILVPIEIESPYATFYWLLIVAMDVSLIVFEIGRN